MRSAFLWLIVAFSLACLNGYGQSPNYGNIVPSSSFKSFIASLDSSVHRVPVEKVHIHFDKPWYSIGDTIWMKVYVVNENNVLSSLSQTVYVDLVSEQDSTWSSLRLPLAQGLGAGAITLDNKLIPPGNYHIRAYTNWMRNFGEAAFFDKKIKIGDALTSTATQVLADTKKTSTATIPDNNVAIQFFPEGGELVNGLTGKIGFKAIGPDGLSRQVAGFITDKDDKQVAAFKTEHAGMGTFVLTPATGNSYTAVIKLANNTEKRVSLPKAKSEGYTLAISQYKENVIVKVGASNGLLNGKLILVAKAKDQILYSGEQSVADIGTGIKIPVKTFPEGMLQFTLFSPDHQLVAERLVFIHRPEKHLELLLTPDKQVYKMRDKIHLNLDAVGEDGNKVAGSFSMAVINEDKVPYKEADEKTIFSDLLLTSELKGYIEQPNYYFSDTSVNIAQQLDNLVLIQGWRKFTDIDRPSIAHADFSYQPELGDAEISGRVLTSRGKPIPNAKINLMVFTGDGQFVSTVANETGFFTINGFPFPKGTGFFAEVENNKNAKIAIDGRDLHPVTLKHLTNEPGTENNFEVYLNNSRKQFDELKRKGYINGKLLQVVEIKERKAPPTIKEIAVKNSSNYNGPGKADQVITFMDLLGCVGTLAECLQGKLTGVKFKGGTPYSIGGESLTGPKPMAIILDGVERPTALSIITSDMISSIEVLRHSGTSVYGLSGAGGVLVITTKRADIDYAAYQMEYFRPGSTKTEASNMFTFMGVYDAPRQFYVPDYNNPAIDKEIADMRSTIYWNPNIMTHSNGKTSVDFFNGATGNYKVIVEGLDMKGHLGRAIYHYKVN